MRLAKGIVLNGELTFGELKFSAMRREAYGRNEDGTSNGIVERRVYDLKSRVQGRMIQVSLPAEVAEKKIPANTVVELVEPEIRTIANARGRNADVNWFLSAKDIVPARNKNQNEQNTKAKEQEKEQPKQDFQKK